MNQRSYHPMLFLALLAVLLGALPSCTLIGRREPLTVYVLPAAPLPASDQARLPLTLRIDTPQANRALEGSRIVVMPEPLQLSTYQGSRWSDNAPTLLRDRLVEGFRQNGRMAAVVDEEDRANSDYDLASDLRAFQSEYAQGQPLAVIRFDVRLIDSGSQRVLDTRHFEVQEPSRNESVEAVVEAFGRAADDLSRQLVDWTLDRVRAK